MQTVTAPGASARTFLIHMFSRGLDDNRYVVERYKSTFDGEIVRWPGKGKSKTGKEPRQIMSLSAVQRMRPERDEIIVCTGVKIAGSGIYLENRLMSARGSLDDAIIAIMDANDAAI